MRTDPGHTNYDFQGLDPKGNPLYSADKITVLEKPKGVNKVARVVYLDESDTLIVADEGEDMRHIGKVFVRYLAGNRDTVSFTSGAGKQAECVASGRIHLRRWLARARAHFRQPAE